eukprot:evm.model.scf_2000.1 EVM.evm.TU.scf_2000.1   scf_2000:6013-10414(+)
MEGSPGGPKQNNSLNPTSNSQVMSSQAARPSIRGPPAGGRAHDSNGSRPVPAGTGHAVARHQPPPGLLLQSSGGRGRGGQVGAPNNMTPAALFANLLAAHNVGHGHGQGLSVAGVGAKPNFPPELLKSISVAAHGLPGVHTSKQMSRPQTALPEGRYQRTVAVAVSEGVQGSGNGPPLVVQSKAPGQAPRSRSGPKVDQKNMPSQLASRVRQLGLQGGLQSGRTLQVQGVNSGQSGNIVIAPSAPASHSGQREGFPLPQDTGRQTLASANSLARTLGPLMQQQDRPNQRTHGVHVGSTMSTPPAKAPQQRANVTSASRVPTSVALNLAPMMLKGTSSSANLPGNLTLVPSFLVQMPGGQFRLVNSSPFLGLREEGQGAPSDGTSNVGDKGKQSPAMPATIQPMSRPEAKSSKAISSPTAVQLSMSRPFGRTVPMERPQRLPNVITTIPQEAKAQQPFRFSAASLGMMKSDAGTPRARFPQSYRVKEPALLRRRTQQEEEQHGLAAVASPVTLSGTSMNDRDQQLVHGHNSEGNVSDKEDKDMISVAESLKDLSSMEMRQASDSPPQQATGTPEREAAHDVDSTSFSHKDRTGEASDRSGTGTDAFSGLDVLIDAATKTEGEFFRSLSKPSASRGISKRRRGIHGPIHISRSSTPVADSIPSAFRLHHRYMGISIVLRSGKYVARCRHKGEAIEIGQFDSAESAAKAYDRTILGLRGWDARTNFPKEDYMKFEVENTARAFKTKESQRSRVGGRRRRESWSPWARAAQTLLGPERSDASTCAPRSLKLGEAMPEARTAQVQRMMTVLSQLRMQNPVVFDEALAKVQSAAFSGDSSAVPADAPNGQPLPLLQDIDQPTQNIEETLKAVLTRVEVLQKLVASGNGSQEDRMSLEQHRYAAEVLQNILNAKTTRQGNCAQTSTPGALGRPMHIKSDPDTYSAASDRGGEPSWIAQPGVSHGQWRKGGSQAFGFDRDGGDARVSGPSRFAAPGARCANEVGHTGAGFGLLPFQPTRLAGRKSCHPSDAPGRASGAARPLGGLEKLGDLSGKVQTILSGGSLRRLGLDNGRCPLSPKVPSRRPLAVARRSARNCPRRDTDIWVMPSLRGRGARRPTGSGLGRSTFIDPDADDAEEELDDRARRGRTVYRYGRRTVPRRTVGTGRGRGRGYRGRGRGRGARRGTGRGRQRRAVAIGSWETPPVGGQGKNGEICELVGARESDVVIEEVAEALAFMREEGGQGSRDHGGETRPSKESSNGRREEGAVGDVRVEAARQVCVEEGGATGGEGGEEEEWEESESLAPPAAGQPGVIGNEELKRYRESLGWGKLLACSLWPKKRGGGMLAKSFDGNYKGHGHRVMLLDVRDELFKGVGRGGGDDPISQQAGL